MGPRRLQPWEPEVVWYVLVPVLGIGALTAVALLSEDLLRSAAWCWVVATVLSAAALRAMFGLTAAELRRDHVLLALILQAVLLNLGFAAVHRGYGLTGEAADGLVPAIYFSVVTFTTLGYGDLQPRQELRLAAAMQAALGYVYLGLIVGLAAAMVRTRAGR